MSELDVEKWNACALKGCGFVASISPSVSASLAAADHSCPSMAVVVNAFFRVIACWMPATPAAAWTPLLAWILLIAVSSLLTRNDSCLATLSLQKSIKDLTQSRQSRLAVLDVFRVVAIFWVMMNHTGSEGRIDILERLPSAEPFKKAVHEHPIFGALLGNSALGVEVFLVLSGLLAARSWLRQPDLPFAEHYYKYISRRFFRLTPSVAVFLYMSTGPIVKSILPRFYTTMVSACGWRGILSHLTFLGNWQSTPTCLGYLWYLGLDMQLQMFAPFLLHLLTRRGRVTVVVISVCIAVSTLLRAAYCTSYNICNKSDVDIPFIFYPDIDAATMANVYAGLWEMYARPYTKAGPFLIGLLCGWATLSMEQSSFRLSRRQASGLFCAGAFLAIATVYAILPEYWYPEMSSNVYNVTYTATFRSVFAVALLLMLTALMFNDDMIYVSPVWAVLARLTFSAYLLHMPVVYIFNHLEYLQKAEGAIALLVVLPGVAVLSFGLAVPFFLFVEAPIGRLVTRMDVKRIVKPAAAAEEVPLEAKVVWQPELYEDIYMYNI